MPELNSDPETIRMRTFDHAMAFDPGLAQRVREALGARPGVSERRMFGGLSIPISIHWRSLTMHN